MKPFFLLCGLLAGLVGSCPAQTPSSPSRELGIQFSDLDFDAFSLIFKKQRGENRWTRFRAVFSDLTFNTRGEDQTNFSLNLSGRVGFERRHPQGDRIALVHGPEFGAGVFLVTDSNQSNDPYTVTALVGYVLGVQYNLGQHLFLNLETLPALTVSVHDDGLPDNDDLSVTTRLGFNSWGTLTAGLRF